MNNLTFTVSCNKKTVTLSPVQLAIYRQCKVIEAIDDSGRKFYLFFIKDTFLHAARLNSIPTGSMLERIFTRGITFSKSHPLTEALLSESAKFHSTSLSQLTKKLLKLYGPLDTALFLTFFEGCISTETLRNHLKKTFYHFRRNGQLLSAYKLLHYYLDFAPDDSFATDMLNNLTFHDYADRYHGSSILSINDPAFLEFYCFNRMEELHCFELIVAIFQQERRWIDELAIRRNHLSISNNQSNFESLQSLVRQKLSHNQQTHFLQNLRSSLPDTEELQMSIFTQLISQEKHTEIIQFLLDEQLSVSNEQRLLITKSFQAADLSGLHADMDRLSKLLLSLYRNEPSILNHILHRYAVCMMKAYELPFIKKWMSTFTEPGVDLPVYNIISEMESHQEDPDQQLALGKLYLYFDQYEKAIDCFKWESELNPERPEPIQHLIKVYALTGSKEEKQAYIQLLHHVNKAAASIQQP